jgi:hypothetical protein
LQSFGATGRGGVEHSEENSFDEDEGGRLNGVGCFKVLRRTGIGCEGMKETSCQKEVCRAVERED